MSSTIYHSTVLPNGIRVVSEEIPHMRSVSVGVWLRVGSRYELPQEQGISHFIEHMMFKGTSNRTARQIAEEFDSVGGNVNAATSREYTAFYAKVLGSDLPMALDIISDMLINSTFSEIDIDRERSVVLEEISLYEDTPEDVVHELFARSIFGDHPLGLSVLGTEETIGSFCRDDFLTYLRKWYTPGNMVISGAGQIEHKKFVEEISARFGSCGEKNPIGCCHSPSRVRNCCVRQKEIEQAHICIGGLGVPRSHDDRMPIVVLDNLIGGGMSSVLFQELREERGLAYSVYSYQSSYQDCGVFGIYCGMSPENSHEVLHTIRQQLARIREYGFGKTDIERAKAQLKGNMILGLESTSSRMSRLAKMALFYDELYTPEQVLDKLDAVTAEQVHCAAARYLSEENLSIAFVSPLEKADVIELTSDFITPVFIA